MSSLFVRHLLHPDLIPIYSLLALDFVYFVPSYDKIYTKPILSSMIGLCRSDFPESTVKGHTSTPHTIFVALAA